MNDIPQRRVLLVDNPEGMLSALKLELEQQGMRVDAVATVADARQSLRDHGLPDGLIVNLQGFEEEGLAFCEEMRLYAGLPIMVLGSVASSEQTVMEALTCADAYLRPNEAESPEIAIRLTRLFERLGTLSISIGKEIQLRKDVLLDLINGVVSINGKQAELTPTEISLLHVLLAHDNQMVDAATLIERVWRGAVEGNPNSLRVHMHRLRKKLGWKKRDERSLITTVRGIGYMLRTRT